MGEGIIDWTRIIKSLAKNKYQGFLSIEYEGRKDKKEGLKKSLNSLNKIIKDLE